MEDHKNGGSAKSGRESGQDKPQSASWLHHLLEDHMWFFMMFLIPFSLMYDLITWIGGKLMAWIEGPAKGRHEDRVRRVQSQVSQWHRHHQDRPMCTARPGWKSVTLQKMAYKDKMYKVEVNLKSILSVDEKNKLVRVEPMITIGQLNDFLISLGWTLPVVPELDDLTIGGLVMGGGIETTSHKYGLFQYICKAYELVMADGSVVWCNRTENTELYAAIPFSYGTLGFLTAVDLDIIPYKPFIELTYIPVHSLDDVVNTFTKVTNDPAVDSVEGIMFSLNDGIIMSGRFVSQDEVQPDKMNRLGRWYKPWFYKYVESFLYKDSGAANTDCHIEFIPTVDFFHRHNKAWFWLMEKMFSFANHPAFRYLLGWTMPPKFHFLKLLRQKLAPEDQTANFVCQDFGYKLDLLKPALVHVDNETKIYPIWLCPTRHIVPPEMQHLSIFRSKDVHVDVGIYGFSPVPNFDRIQSQKRMEKYAIDQGCYMGLYAENQLSRNDFYRMFTFNLGLYDQLRKKLNCEKAFPHVYDKISQAARSG